MTSSVIEIDGARGAAFLLFVNACTVVVAALHGASLARATFQAQRRLVSQARHLKLLLPA